MTFCLFLLTKIHITGTVWKRSTHAQVLDISYQPALQHFATLGAIMFVCRYFLRTCLRSSINRALEHFASPGATCTLFRQLELDSSAHQSVHSDIKPSSENNFSYGGFYCSPSFGGSRGMFFNDGTYSSIRRITVTVNQETLTSVQLDYGIEGQIFRGVRHGGANGTAIVYELNPGEIVTKISGFYGGHHSWVIIKSLTFHTNRTKLSQCGPEHGTYFQTNKEEGKIIGIHGFGSAGFLDSIGVYMLKLPTFKHGGRVD